MRRRYAIAMCPTAQPYTAWTPATNSHLMKRKSLDGFKLGQLLIEAFHSDENSINRHIKLDPCYALIKDI